MERELVGFYSVLSCAVIENTSNFPYLKTPDLSDAQREKLMRQLKNETDEMEERFAVLIGRTLLSLKKYEVSIGELKSLLKQLNAPKKSKLFNKLKKVTDINRAFEVLHRFWSFFDYEILGVIIRKFCYDINQDFEEYVSKFKKFCDRRVCEVPDDSYSTKLSESDEKKNLHIQIDQTFINELERLKMVDLKDVTDTLGKILNTNLRILKIRDTSIIFTFRCLHELEELFPLSSAQKEKLQEIGVRSIYSGEKLPTAAGKGIIILL